MREEDAGGDWVLRKNGIFKGFFAKKWHGSDYAS
jgi:hypothetical protein